MSSLRPLASDLIKHGLDSEADTIINWLKSMNVTKEWKDGFNPAPETIINQRRWEDGDSPKVKYDWEGAI